VFDMRAAIFDLDGVIVDTARFHLLAWSRLAAELGFALAPVVNERLKGVSRMRSLEIVLEAGGVAELHDPASRLVLADRKNRWYMDMVSAMDPGELLPGALDCLKEYREVGVRTALGTASRNAPLVLDRLGIRSCFDTVVDGESVTRPKPDPEVFLVAARRLGIPPAKCAVFEDAVAGIEAARRAGMYAVGIGRHEALTLSRFRELHIRPAGSRRPSAPAG
jgi:beta-phosphoglucomutase